MMFLPLQYKKLFSILHEYIFSQKRYLSSIPNCEIIMMKNYINELLLNQRTMPITTLVLRHP